MRWQLVPQFLHVAVDLIVRLRNLEGFFVDLIYSTEGIPRPVSENRNARTFSGPLGDGNVESDASKADVVLDTDILRPMETCWGRTNDGLRIFSPRGAQSKPPQLIPGLRRESVESGFGRLVDAPKKVSTLAVAIAEARGRSPCSVMLHGSTLTARMSKLKGSHPVTLSACGSSPPGPLASGPPLQAGASPALRLPWLPW